MEIPGFYYCPEKKRHFKIGPGFQPPKLKPKTLSELNPIERKRSTNLRKILTNRLVLNGKIPKNAFTEWTLKNERFKECFIKISIIHKLWIIIFATNFRVYEKKFFKLLKTQISAKQHSKLFVSPGGNFALQEQQDGKSVVLKLNFNKVSWYLFNR